MSETTQQFVEQASSLGDNAIDGVQALKFTRISDYTNFNVEYATEERDLIVHFFPPPEHVVAEVLGDQTSFKWKSKQLEDRWVDGFADLLSDTASEYFHASFPILKAAYIPELRSWWFRGKNVLGVSPVEHVMNGFIEKLDALCDQVWPAKRA